jgi:hypothetical protein
MPTPVTFNKVVIWVDDKLEKIIPTIRIIEERGVEVIHLPSTYMAKKWMQEFCWLFNWIDFKFKVISNNVREENGMLNFNAGIEIVKMFQDYSTPIFIYCEDTVRAKENARKQNIQEENIKISKH